MIIDSAGMSIVAPFRTRGSGACVHLRRIKGGEWAVGSTTMCASAGGIFCRSSLIGFHPSGGFRRVALPPNKGSAPDKIKNEDQLHKTPHPPARTHEPQRFTRHTLPSKCLNAIFQAIKRTVRLSFLACFYRVSVRPGGEAKNQRLNLRCH